MKRLAREKLAEKDIDWKEVYTDKTLFLKEMYDDVVGPGSYFRFEGEDSATGDNYYCILGPAKIKKPRAKFFAGVRKLPATYSAGGKYFDSLDAAASYAKETWGIPTPMKLKPYTASKLVGVAQRVDQWKAHREKEEEKKEDQKEEKKEVSSGRVNLNMKSFNLAKHLVEAMGYQRQENRDPYEWWDYEQLRGGGNPQWNQWLQVDPSLTDVLSYCADWRNKTYRILGHMYGLSRQQLDNIWKTYIGYHPSYGAYLCSIGPYYGDTFAEEARDKFAYFIIRKRKSTQDELAESLRKNLEVYMKMYQIQLEPGDLQFVVRAPTPEEEFNPEADRQGNRDVIEVVTSMDPNDPAAQDFYNRAPIVSDGSNFGLNTRGLDKIMRGKWAPLYERAIAEKAAEHHISPEEASVMVLRDLNFLKSIYKKIQKFYRDMAQTGEGALMGMSPPPQFSNLSFRGRSGSLKFRTLPTNQLQANALALRKEIIEVMVEGVNTPEEIQSRLNALPNRRNRQVSLGDVQERVAEIRQLVSNRRSTQPEVDESAVHQQLITESSGQIEQLESKKGFDDLRSAFDMAKLYFTHLPVDPKTGSKDMSALRYAPRMAFDPPENFQNVTSDELREIRLAYETMREQTGGEGEASDAVMEQQIGPRQEEVAETESQEAEVTEEIAETPSPKTKTTDEEAPGSSISGLFATTINSLIKIAEELDQEGKSDAAEEIHKVIRKYEEEI